jgi:DNA-binding PadR family transcriptional regulator
MGKLCEMRGYLQFLILWFLGRNHMSGSQMAAEIERRKGSKPSPGTIYPVLKNLKKKGLIKEVRHSKNNKVYALTSDGRRELNESCIFFCRTFYDLQPRFRKLKP